LFNLIRIRGNERKNLQWLGFNTHRLLIHLHPLGMLSERITVRMQANRR